MDHLQLKDLLRQLDGGGYPGYKRLVGRWCFPRFTLSIDHVQGDPFASPSRISLLVPRDTVGLPPALYSNRSRRIGTQDALLRALSAALRQAGGRRGSGHSGELRVDMPGQAILERSACRIDQGTVVARLTVGLPAAGRRILGREAYELLCEDLPEIVEKGLCYAALDTRAIQCFAESVEDQDALRSQLEAAGLVAFVANGSVLPRRSGADDRPMQGSDVVPWRSPAAMEVCLEAPNRGSVRGTGFRQGVTLITGGGYHGKSTLLQALSSGVYNHVPGDGREGVVTLEAGMRIRAEDGRRVCGVDISPFIGNLPQGRSTRCFTTDDASGSTSQAANILEALEVGARLLLIDEDTSATNFMIRDRRMQRLVDRSREPITPFVDQVRSLHERLGCSSILVVGGSGDYLDVADQVLLMDAFVPLEVTEEARDICRALPTGRVAEVGAPLERVVGRIPLPESLDPSQGRRAERVRARATRGLQFGEEEVDLTAVEQLIDDSQTRTLGDGLLYAHRQLVDGKRSVRQICVALEARIAEQGPLGVGPIDAGDRAAVRRLELAAALNRLRSLKVQQEPG